MIIVPIKKRMEIIARIQVGKSKHQYHASQCGEHHYSTNNKKNRDYYVYPCLSYFTDKPWPKAKWWKQKLLLQIQSINIIYPNEENIIVVLRTKRAETTIVSKFVLFYGWTLIMRKMVARKLFLQIQNIHIV